MSAQELFDEWGAAWVTRDPAERVARLEACCTEDVEFTPPDEDRPVVRGRAALIEHVRAYTASWPDGVTVTLAQPPSSHHDWSRAYVRWSFPSADAIGCDIIRIEDGKIAAMLVFTEVAATAANGSR
jgi:ketosteroid isomerase-like protein